MAHLLKAHYDRMWQKNPGVPAYLKAIYPAIQQLRLGPESKVLDVACGNGMLGAWLRSESGCQIYGTDLSTVALEECERLGYQTELADLDHDRLPFTDVRFDAVVVSAIVEHVLDPQALLDQAYRVLKPGGHVVVLTPNVTWIASRLLFALGRWDHPLLGGTRGHVSYVNWRQLTEMLSRAGFVDANNRYSVLYSSDEPVRGRWPVRMVKRLVNNRQAPFWPSLLALNFIVTAQKPAAHSSASHLSDPSRERPCDLHCHLPATVHKPPQTAGLSS